MKDLFSKKRKSLIGVDISSTHIKMIELSGTADNMKVEHYVIESIPEGLYSDHSVSDVERLGKEIHSAWQKLDTSNKDVVLSIPAAMVISKKFEMPADLSIKDQISQVESEAANYIPFTLDEVNLDFQILGPVEGKEGVVEVYLAVSKKQHVEERLAVTQMAGLNAKVLDIDQMAVIHALSEMSSVFEKGTEDKNIMVVDLGAQHTEYQVLRNFESIYTRDHTFSISTLKNNIMTECRCDAHDAELLIKGSSSLLEKYPDYSVSVLQPFLDSMAIEIIRHIQLFESSSIWTGVDYIVLSGGAAILEGLDETISQRTGIDTQVANPMICCNLAKRIRPDSLLLDAPSLVVAFGLALRSFV